MEALASVECAGCEWERQPQAFRWFPELGTPLRASSRPPAHRVDDVGRCQADRERRDSGRARPVERRGTLRAHNHTPSGSSTAATSSRKTVTCHDAGQRRRDEPAGERSAELPLCSVAQQRAGCGDDVEQQVRGRHGRTGHLLALL
jgi:hypothetical protein